MNLSPAHSALKLSALIGLASACPLFAQVNYGIDYSNYSVIVNNYASFAGNTHVHRGALIGNTLDPIGGGLTDFSRDLTAAEKASTTYPTLYVGGTVLGGSGEQIGLNDGSYHFGNVSGALFLQNSPNSVSIATDLFHGAFAKEYGEFQQEASRMGKLASTQTLSYVSDVDQEGKRLTINVATGQTTVLNLSAAELGAFFSNSSHFIRYTGITSLSTKLIINVWGNHDNFTLNYGSNFDGIDAAYYSNIVWNFRDINNLTINSNGLAFKSTILAADSVVTWNGSGDLEGQMIAYNLIDNANHEYHNYGYFTSELPPVPEPSTYALFGAASCGALAFLRRRRKAV